MLRALLSALCVLALIGRASAADASTPPGELLGTVWSGHPVTFGFLTERGHQFIAYYDADRRITVLGRKLTTPASAWTRFQPPGIPVPARKRDSNVVAWDSHNTLRLALDRDGHLHLSGNMHADPLVYYRTRVPRSPIDFVDLHESRADCGTRAGDFERVVAGL